MKPATNPVPGSLSFSYLEDCSQAFHDDRAARISANAAATAGIPEASADWAALQKLPFTFSTDLKQGSVTNQKSSGRCWLFAGLNFFRYEMIRKFHLEDFELSQNYLFFYDKLERSNYFLENIIRLASEPLDGRLMQLILSDPIGDGGQWDMFANLVRKYGVVPHNVYPDTANSIKSHGFNRYLCTLLREFAKELRTAVLAGTSVDQIRVRKEEMMKDVYRILVIALGEPPRTFDFTVTDKDGKVYNDFALTGREFFDKYIGLNMDDYVSLINGPTQDKPYDRLYTIKYLGNVMEGAPITYLNLPMDQIREAVVRQIQDEHPVWFGSDCGQFALREQAVFDRESAAMEQLLGIQYHFTKADRLDYADSAMNHAMLLLGFHMDAQGRPDRWHVENSWGKDSGPNAGHYIASDSWFEEFVYQAVIDKKYLDERTRELLNQERIALELWDPMGTLARTTR